MTQADFTIANQTFPNTRTELNTSLQALATNSAGNSAPSTTYANQWWFDSDNHGLQNSVRHEPQRLATKIPVGY